MSEKQQIKPILTAGLFPELLDGLLDLLKSLSAEEWKAPTNGEWSVKDVVVHLLGGDFGIISWKRDKYSEFVEVGDWDELVGLINGINDNWIKNGARFSPRLLIELLQFTGEKISQIFQDLDPHALGVPVDWVGADPMPIWVDVAREFTERWHHQQHIRDAVGKPGFKEPKYLEPVMDAFMLALPRTYKDEEAETGTKIQIELTGGLEKKWLLEKENSNWCLYTGDWGECQAHISLDADAAWRIFTKGLTVDQALSFVSMQGNLRLAQKVLETVSIIA
ncbi:MAG: maleylpyruvate isomerase N-terminal domain-containing protein [Anaerolineaceae bacterium]|nr:maleylpyruvate isomerase N-terminal domain-containing protein [Anaerolineaceae bacterium]